MPSGNWFCFTEATKEGRFTHFCYLNSGAAWLMHAHSPRQSILPDSLSGIASIGIMLAGLFLNTAFTPPYKG